jgi:hypothetical protein
MVERLQGKHSQWDPYLSFLPDSFGHMPFMWTEEQQKELRGRISGLLCGLDRCGLDRCRLRKNRGSQEVGSQS